MDKVLNGIKKYTIFIGIAVFAIFVLPGFPSPIFIPKEIILSIIVSLVLILTLIKGIVGSEIKFSPGKFDVPVLLIVIAYLLSSILKTPNKMEAFFYPGMTTFVVLSAVFYFIVNQLTKRGKNSAFMAVFISGVIVAVLVLFAQLGIFAKIPQLPAFMKDSAFSPLGGGIQTILYMLVVLPFAVIQMVKEKAAVNKVFFGVAGAVMFFAIFVLGINMLPGKAQSPVLPTLQNSWVIAVETLKESPILGAGPANYLSAFNLYRPLSFNQTNLWQVRFSSATNYYLTLIVELGFAGVAAIVILLVSAYRRSIVLVKEKSWEILSLAILIVGLAFVPAVPALIFLLMVLLAIFSDSENKSLNVAIGRVPVIIVASPVLAAIVALGIFGTRAVSAEVYFQKSLNALVANNANDTYKFMTQAVTLNPYIDRYHASLAQVDMALANSLATKENLTDDDKTTISQLVQQAISEGKSTVTLNLGRAGNWEILAQVYRSIMGFAQGADQFAVQTYTQAVALDPINPDLRISLGGVYYALGDYDNAISAFQMAIVAKNDHANAHYNLASAYAAKKDYDKAVTEMNNVLSLVQKDSTDYKTAQEALAQLEKQKPSSTTNATQQGQLSAPEAVQQTNIEPPIELPSEATPPAVTQ